MASSKAKPVIIKQQENKSATTENAVVIKNSASDGESTEINHPQFQAVGIIKGSVKFNDENEKNPLSITIGNKEYQLFYRIVMLLDLWKNCQNLSNKLQSLSNCPSLVKTRVKRNYLQNLR